nr:hypothetical protein [Nanoarchaeum sp.]
MARIRDRVVMEIGENAYRLGRVIESYHDLCSQAGADVGPVEALFPKTRSYAVNNNLVFKPKAETKNRHWITEENLPKLIEGMGWAINLGDLIDRAELYSG